MNGLQVALFVYSYLPEGSTRKILPFLGPLTIFRPWFMEDRPDALEGVDLGLIRVLRPPVDLKPKGDFKALMSSYKGWVSAGPDKSIIAFLKARGGRMDEDDTTWEIRGALRQKGESPKPPEENSTWKWHLLLHLTQELEDERRDADRMLKVLKEQGSPLRGAVEEGESQSFLEDLPRFDADRTLDASLLVQVYEAWFSLFESYLGGRDLLVAPDRYIMNHVADLWQEYGEPEQGTLGTEATCRLPDLSHLGPEELARIKGRLAEKTGKLRQAIADLGDPTADRSGRHQALFDELEDGWPWDLASGTLRLSLRYFAPYPVTRHGEKERILKHLFGKTMMLAETEEAHRERSPIQD